MLGVRLDPETERALEALAQRTRRTKSDIAREAVRAYVRRQDAGYAAEARRQSRLVAQRDDPALQEELDALALDGGIGR